MLDLRELIPGLGGLFSGLGGLLWVLGRVSSEDDYRISCIYRPPFNKRPPPFQEREDT